MRVKAVHAVVFMEHLSTQSEDGQHVVILGVRKRPICSPEKGCELRPGGLSTLA